MSRLDPETANLDGLTVIEASAGTGKTYAIQKIVARLVREGVPVQRMVVTSFTNAAADELGDRIRRELESALVATPADSVAARGRLERADVRATAEPVGAEDDAVDRLLAEAVDLRLAERAVPRVVERGRRLTADQFHARRHHDAVLGEQAIVDAGVAAVEGGVVLLDDVEVLRHGIGLLTSEAG